MNLDTSDYIAIFCAVLGAGLSLLGVMWYSKKQQKNMITTESENTFKSIIISDIANYQNEDNSFSYCVLSLYPKHKKALDQLFIHISERKKIEISKLWNTYEALYNERASFGVFGVVTTELPHPDFEASIENVSHIERKRKKQIYNILSKIVKIL